MRRSVCPINHSKVVIFNPTRCVEQFRAMCGDQDLRSMCRNSYQVKNRAKSARMNRGFRFLKHQESRSRPLKYRQQKPQDTQGAIGHAVCTESDAVLLAPTPHEFHGNLGPECYWVHLGLVRQDASQELVDLLGIFRRIPDDGLEHAGCIAAIGFQGRVAVGILQVAKPGRLNRISADGSECAHHRGKSLVPPHQGESQGIWIGRG